MFNNENLLCCIVCVWFYMHIDIVRQRCCLAYDTAVQMYFVIMPLCCHAYIPAEA